MLSLTLLLACSKGSGGTGSEISTDGYFPVEAGTEQTFRLTSAGFADTGDLGDDELDIVWASGGCGDLEATLTQASTATTLATLDWTTGDAPALCASDAGTIDPALTVFEAQVQEGETYSAGSWTGTVHLVEDFQTYYGSFPQAISVDVAGGSGTPAGWTLTFGEGIGLVGLVADSWSADLVFQR